MQNCTKCDLYKGCPHPCIWGTGDPNADIMLVGEAPGAEESLRGVPFIGKAGQKLNNILSAAGFNREDLYVTNTIKCQPPGNRVPTKEEITACCDYLEQEIASVKPKIIVPLGNTALQYILGVTGITKHVGIESFSEKYQCKIIPTFHPSYILRKPEHEQIAVSHFKKIRKILKGKLEKTPVKYVNATTLEKVDKLFKRLKSVDIFAMDIETTGFDFLEDKVLCISFSWKENTAVLLPLLGYKQCKMWEDDQFTYIKEGLKEILASDVKKILQNGAFDLKFLKTWGTPVKNFTFDTMLAHHLVDENAEGFHGLKDLALMFTDMGDYSAELVKIQKELKKEENTRRREQVKEIKKRKDLDKKTRNQMVEDLKNAKEEFSFADIPEEVLWRYAAADADATYRMYKILRQKIYQEEKEKLHSLPQHRGKSLMRLFNRIIMPQRNILNEMEYAGALLDLEYLDKLDKEYSQKIKDLEAEFDTFPEVKETEKLLTQTEEGKIAVKYVNLKKPPKNISKGDYIAKYTKPVKFNPKSPQHLQVLLFDVLKLKPLSFSEKTGAPSTDKDIFVVYADTSEIVKRLAENRRLVKFHKTYIVGMRSLVDKNGRVHTDYKSHGTVTGRLSSNHPNLQNIPRGSDIKKAFISPPGYCMVQIDLAQAEFRFWGQLSGDQLMLEDIRNGLDIHKQTAANFWGIPKENVTKEQRNQAKFCVGENTIVPTPTGLKFIKDIKKGDYVYDHENKQQRVLKTVEYEDDTFNVVTKYGTLTCNKTHPFFVIENGKLITKTLNELNVGDQILKCGKLLNKNKKILKWAPNYQKRTNYKSIKDEWELTKDLAYLCGFILAEGYFVLDTPYLVTISQSGDLVPVIRKTTNSLFPDGNFTEFVDNQGTTNWQINNKEFCEFLKFLGFGRINSKKGQKYFPMKIFEASPKVQKAFLQGLFDGDGTVKCVTGKYVSLCSVSKHIINNTQLLLEHLGITSHIRKEVKEKYQTAYFVHIDGSEEQKFAKLISSRSPKNQEKLSKLFTRTCVRNARYIDGIRELVDDYPCGNVRADIRLRKRSTRLSHYFLRKFCRGHNKFVDYLVDNNIYSVEITDIISAGKQIVYDFETTGSKVLVGNGFYTLDCVFGIMYGRGAKSVAKQVGVTEKDADGLIKQFLAKYPTAAKWLKDTKKFCKTYGYVVNHFGRIRRLPTIFSQDSQMKAMAERQSINAPIQSTSADFTGIVMIRIWNLIQKHKFDCKLVLTVHDSIIFECNKKDKDEFIKLTYPEIVKGAEGIKVKLGTEVEVGNNWLELKEVDIEKL